MNISWRRLAIAAALTTVGYLFGPDVAVRLEAILMAMQGAAY